jgi:hypothetical protein
MDMPDSGDSGAHGLLEIHRGLIPWGLVEDVVGAPACVFRMDPAETGT